MKHAVIDVKKSFGVMTLFGVLTGAGLLYCLHMSVNWIINNFSSNMGNDVILQKTSVIKDHAVVISDRFYLGVVPITMAAVLVVFWLAWLILKTGAKSKGFDSHEESEQKARKTKKDFIDRKLEQERKVRLFLHPLSVLQRDGRLLDFFQEDLGLYDDDQIGAAVRSIQEDCKKTIKKYINLKSVIPEEEGDEIIIEQDFDIDSIILTGNVSGKPPFKGVVKHRGWKAGKKELPKLSDTQDAAIIVPAEVEIQ